MIIKMKYILLMVFPIFLVSCNYSEKEKKLREREKILSEKENAFAKKEAEYQQLINMRDSLYHQNDSVSVAIWPDSILGKWNSKVICTESNCTDYAIGDQRSDTWLFENDSTQAVAKIFSNNRLIRIYNGKYRNNGIKLSYKTDSTAQKKVNMNIDITEITPNRMRGTRSVTINGQCAANFSVELVRPK